MHQQTKILFLFLFLWLVNKAQGQNGKRAENTILKIDKGENPYSKKQSDWLVKNGFNVRDYDWSDKYINTQLDGVFKQKSGATLWAGVSATFGAIAIKKLINNEEGKYFLMTLSLSSAWVSYSKYRKTKKRVQQVEIWNNSRSKPTLSNELNAINHSNQIDSSIVLLDRNFHLQSPYKPSKNKFLTENGFSVQQYNWEDEQINLKLEQAFLCRTTGHVLLGTAIPTAFMGLFANLVHALSENPDKSNSLPGRGFFIASGVMVTGSMVSIVLGQSKVRKAEHLRKTPQPNKSKLSFSDVE